MQLRLQATRSAASTSDSLCRALLGAGGRKKDRAALLEARQLCESAIDVIKAAGDNATETGRQSSEDRRRAQGVAIIVRVAATLLFLSRCRIFSSTTRRITVRAACHRGW